MAASLAQDSPAPEATLPLLVRGRTISFELEHSTPGTLALFDVQGAHVRTLEEGMLGFGRQDVVWDGRDDRGIRARSGWYYCRLVAGGISATSRLLYVK
jgi:flagellar hook assembly protein FlgD